MLLHGEETSVWADKGYVSAEREAAFTGPGKVWGVMRKAPKGGALHPLDVQINRIIASPAAARTCGATTGNFGPGSSIRFG